MTLIIQITAVVCTSIAAIIVGIIVCRVAAYRFKFDASDRDSFTFAGPFFSTLMIALSLVIATPQAEQFSVSSWFFPLAMALAFVPPFGVIVCRKLGKLLAALIRLIDMFHKNENSKSRP